MHKNCTSKWDIWELQHSTCPKILNIFVAEELQEKQTQKMVMWQEGSPETLQQHNMRLQNPQASEPVVRPFCQLKYLLAKDKKENRNIYR